MRKEATRWLAHFRRHCAEHDIEAIDLTNGQPDGVPAYERASTPFFDWKRYVCSHTYGFTIVGDGVVRFEGRYVNSPEPNARKLGLPGRFGPWRFDFVVHRCDGSCVRLHPSKQAEAEAVMGTLESWLFGTRAPTPGYSAQGPAPVHQTLGPVDVISSETAERMLLDRLITASQQGGIPVVEVTEDLLHNDWFDYVRFLKGRPFGRQLLHEGVTGLTLVCSASTPATPMLIVTTSVVPADRAIWFKNGRAAFY